MITNKILRLISIILFLFFIQLSYAGSIQSKVVITKGYGANENLAIKNALVQALINVKGAEISSEVIEKTLEIIENDSVNNYEKMTENISVKTKGVIKNYQVISITPENKNLIKAEIKSTIAFYNKGPQLDRLRMAVMPFRINKKIYNDQTIQFMDDWSKKLEEGLTQTRRFAMIDKSYVYEANQELSQYTDERYDLDELARIGNKAGIDYMIVGTLETLENQNVVIADKTIPMQEVSISLRIIDVATGQIKFAKTVAQAKKTVKDILFAIYPISIVAVNDNFVTLGSGGDFLKKGMRFKVVKLGKPLIEPYTKERLGNEEIDVGEITLTEVNAKTSKAEINRGKSEIQKSLNQNLILRPLNKLKKKDFVDELDDVNY